VKSKHVFILRSVDFVYALKDPRGFFELPEKWYSQVFTSIDVPASNRQTVCVNGAYVEIPILPTSLYDRKVSAKRRKKTHTILFDRVYPTWRHVHGETIHFEVAKRLKPMFDRADRGELLLPDPFAAYADMEQLERSKTGKLALLTVAGFVYHQCRENLGYPVEPSM